MFQYLNKINEIFFQYLKSCIHVINIKLASIRKQDFCSHTEPVFNTSGLYHQYQADDSAQKC